MNCPSCKNYNLKLNSFAQRIRAHLGHRDHFDIDASYEPHMGDGEGLNMFILKVRLSRRTGWHEAFSVYKHYYGDIDRLGPLAVAEELVRELRKDLPAPFELDPGFLPWRK